MRHAWHIARKDLRSQRWLLLAWIILVAINIANRMLGPLLYDQNLWRREFERPYLFTVALAYLLVPALLVANIVQGDGLIGTTAFWLTRPISRGTMLLAKLLGVFLIVLTPALVGEAILMAAFHVSPTTILAASLQQAEILGVGILVIALAAAVTSNVPRLVILLIGGGVAFYVWTVIRFLITHYSTEAQPQQQTDRWFGGPPARFMDPSLGIIVFGLVAVGALVAIVFQYRRRWPVAAIAIFAASLILNVQTIGAWAEVSLFGGEPTLANEPWSNGPITVHHGEPLTSRALEASAVMLDRSPRRLIVAPLTIDGLPAGYTTSAFTMTAHMQFRDGSIAWSDPSAAWKRRQPVDHRFWRDEEWPVIMRGWDEAFRKAHDQPGHYTATFDIGVKRHEILASLPLAVGAGYSDGARGLYVTAFRRIGDDYCLVTFKKTVVNLVTDVLWSPDLIAAFRLRDGTPLWDPQEGAAAPDSRRGTAAYDVSPAHPFRVDVFDAAVIYATQDAGNSGPRCEDIVVEIERVHYAGRLTRAVDLPDLQLNGTVAEDRPR